MSGYNNPCIGKTEDTGHWGDEFGECFVSEIQGL